MRYSVWFLCTFLSIFTMGCAENKPAAGKGAVDAPRVLYLTSAGWFHDYEAQTKLIVEALSDELRVDVDVLVGDVEYLRAGGFSKGYDLLIYNFCHASRRDSELVESLIRPVRDHGIPLIALHCTMHSFQYVPQWPEFLGLDTLTHEAQRDFVVQRAAAHPVSDRLNFPWKIESDELYINRAVADSSQPLMKAFGVETQRDHVQTWARQAGKGQLMATTLGHNDRTLKDSNFKQFIVRSAAYLLGGLGVDGEIAPSLACSGTCERTIPVSAEPGTYSTPEERSCVVKKMFSIGVPAVEGCIASCEADSAEKMEACTLQCRLDNPWPAPESLWASCRGGG